MSDYSVGRPGSIFISYRSDDTGETASALARELGRIFGAESVFIDHLGLRAGTAFPDALLTAVSRATVVLAMIGRSWLTLQDRHGTRLLDLPEDWVRQELEHALSSAARTVPVYIEGASRLSAAAFRSVPSLQPLTELQGLDLRRRSWEPDLALLRECIVDCGLPEARREAVAEATANIAERLESAVASPTRVYQRTTLERLMADLELIHKDYLMIFESLLEQVPDAWERGLPHFAGAVRAAAALLRRLRQEYEPARVRVRMTTSVLTRSLLPAAEHEFVVQVLAYFPSGELRTAEAGGWKGTSATALLEHLYCYPDGEAGQELGGIVRGTVTFHRERWSRVCLAYAEMQLSWSQ